MSELTYYEPYQCSFSAGQTALLKLWDELGIPHKKKKQVFGSKLTIIGINVDANKLVLTLPPENRKELLDQLKEFARTPEKQCQVFLKGFPAFVRMVQLGFEHLSATTASSVERICKNVPC